MIVTSSLTAGGAERQAANTVTELVRAHPRVDSVVLGAASLSTRRRRNFYLSRIRHLPIDIVSLEDLAIEDPLGHPDVEPFREILGYFTADIRADIARWIIVFSAQRPQVVHTWQDYINIAAGVAALLVGVPRLVMGTRNTRPDNKYRRLKRYMHTAYNEMVKLPSVGLINNSIAGARDYEAWLGLREGECGVIWNGLNLSSLTEQAREQSDMRRTLGIPDGVPVMGGVFRMSDEKRPLLWLDTAAIVARAHPDAHFIMCGDGVLYNDVRDYAKQIGLNERIHLPGIVEASDADAGSDRGRMHLPGIVANIGAWYGAMTIFLLASRKEGLPNVLIEAQAFGMPVVSANVGGAAEVIIAGETGWVVDDADAEKLADRVLWCLARPDWMEACKGKAPGFVRATFTLDAMAAGTLNAYGL
jgi:glycosyltransferase involved in cell wall biosynthesis